MSRIGVNPLQDNTIYVRCANVLDVVTTCRRDCGHFDKCRSCTTVYIPLHTSPVRSYIARLYCVLASCTCTCACAAHDRITPVQMTLRNRLQFVYSCDLNDVYVQVKLVALEGLLPPCTNACMDALEQCATLAHLRPRPSTSDAPTLFAQVQVYRYVYATRHTTHCAHVYSDGRAIGRPVMTSHRALPPPTAAGDGASTPLLYMQAVARHKWNEWLTLPIKYS